MNVSEDKKKIISARINESIEKLPDHLKAWAKDHLIEPVYIHVSEKTDGEYNEFVIQVTGDVGINDSSYHIFYDENKNLFGLICILENDFFWKMGLCGEFDETVWGM
jgi:hypothetical protein